MGNPKVPIKNKRIPTINKLITRIQDDELGDSIHVGHEITFEEVSTLGVFVQNCSQTTSSGEELKQL